VMTATDRRRRRTKGIYYCKKFWGITNNPTKNVTKGEMRGGAEERRDTEYDPIG